MIGGAFKNKIQVATISTLSGVFKKDWLGIKANNKMVNLRCCEIHEIKDDKIRFSKRALDKDPMDWFKENKKKIGDVITTRVHEVMKTGVKVSVDNDKKIIVSIKKGDLAKSSADARPEVFAPGNALDAKITELDIEKRKIKLTY